uniref:Putative lipocalin n=1 Tax=Ixodes ricinus TaxID=34613 RepID=A0A6B0UZQ1_IXORI
MIAALFLLIQLLGQSKSETVLCEGDFPNATEVISSLNRTYLFQSLQNMTRLKCAYQDFYYKNVPGYGNKHIYDAVFVYYEEIIHRHQNNPLYIKSVVNSTIHLWSHPVVDKGRTDLGILYSDSKKCMVVKNLDTRAFPQACNLWVTNNSFESPPTECINAFQRHCGSNHIKYGIGDCVGRRDYRNL